LDRLSLPNRRSGREVTADISCWATDRFSRASKGNRCASRSLPERTRRRKTPDHVKQPGRAVSLEYIAARTVGGCPSNDLHVQMRWPSSVGLTEVRLDRPEDDTPHEGVPFSPRDPRVLDQLR